jgi:hypothetical protein
MTSVESNQPGKPRISPAQADLGGFESDVPLTPGQEDALVAQGLGNDRLKQKVGCRQRATAKKVKDEKRFSDEQQEINRVGRRLAQGALFKARDEGASESELSFRTSLRIKHGDIVPIPVSDMPPMTKSEEAFIGFEQGGVISGSKPLPEDPNQPSLFDESTQPEVAEPKPEKPSPEIIEAYEKIMEALSVYKQVIHAEVNIDNISKKHENPGALLDGMRARADNAIRDAYPSFDRLLNVWLLEQQGYTTDQIGHMRYRMIKNFKDFANKTTSAERKAFIADLKESEAN